MLQATKMTDAAFNQFTSDERVRHIIEQSEYYGYSGNRVKGLIFCSRVKECEELSKKFNELGCRTVALSGNDNEDKRQEAFERLAMDEKDATEDRQPLDYIFSRNILNEGWEFPEAAKWLTKDQLDSVAWLPADILLIDQIRKCMK